jgi:hypothetical protein
LSLGQVFVHAGDRHGPRVVQLQVLPTGSPVPNRAAATDADSSTEAGVLEAVGGARRMLRDSIRVTPGSK